jgi:ethanolamine utilization microcompartment shell protein EutS
MRSTKKTGVNHKKLGLTREEVTTINIMTIIPSSAP